MRVCVVGSGGREHALAHCLGRSAEVIATPGNPGISGRLESGHTMSSTSAPPEEIEADLFVIGPEAPLVDGLADRLRAEGKLVFGPGADGAALEGSKTFLKRLMDRAKVPTASWASFSAGQLDEAHDFLSGLKGGYVVKTDGLAAGKGVLVTDDLAEARDDVTAKLSGTSFGDAGRRVVIEEKMTGQELSVFAVCDGKRAVALSPAQDYKRLGTGGTGPNTGGMGSYSPVEAVGPELLGSVLERFIEPTLAALSQEGIDYRGALYAGLMLTPLGPKLVEFNVRFGDPETQVVLPRLTSDLADLLAAAAGGDLSRAREAEPTFSSRAAVCVVAASPGYPAEPLTGGLITGVPEAGTLEDVLILHAGTRRDESGNLRTAGGRVICATGLGSDVEGARSAAYEAIGRIHFEGMQYREDIAAEPLVSHESRVVS